jgi:hypothetical protein
VKPNIIEIKVKKTFLKRRKHLLIIKYGKKNKVENKEDFEKILSKIFGIKFNFKDFDLNSFPLDFYYFIKKVRINGELLFEVKDSLDRLFLCEYGRKKSVEKAFSYLKDICGLEIVDESNNKKN